MTPTLSLRCALAALLALLSWPTLTTAQIQGGAEANDNFGSAVATGDFDGDGRDDLAVGVPGEAVGSVDDAGAVNVIYGAGAAGLATADNQLWHQNTTGVSDTAELADDFGTAVASGDFDNDGYDDLAVGVPGETVDGDDFAGVVHLFYGSASGLTASRDVIIHQNTPGVEGAADVLDRFGKSLIVGNFDGDAYDDLAVGVPGESIGSASYAGAVNVLYGGSSGITAAGNLVIHLGVSGVIGDPVYYDGLGEALAAGDFDSDGYDDLAVGAPRKDVGTAANAGIVYEFSGTAGGIDPALDTVWHQGPLYDDPEEQDYFGNALAAGDFDGDGNDDLAVGVPFETYLDVYQVGAVNVIYGHDVYGLYSDPTEFWSQGTSGVPGEPEYNDQFGWAVAAGDFDNDGRDDLAVGVHFEGVGSASGAGAVIVLYGSSSYGLETTGAQSWHQDVSGVVGVAGTYDYLGKALATGDFDNDGRDDLAAGAPGEDVGSAGGAGAVNVLYGTGTAGLSATGDQIWYQGGNGTRQAEETDEDALAAAEQPVEAAAEAAVLTLTPPTPNPFAGRTTLRFTLPAPGAVRLTVHDALGRTVAVLVDEAREAGEHAVAFDAGTLPSGTYLVRIEAGGQVQTQRLTRLR